MNPQPGVNERTDQPCPDRALMISRITGAQIAEVFGFVIGCSRLSERRPTGVSSLVFGRLPAPVSNGLVQNRVSQREGENLVWAAGRIITLLAVDHVVQIISLRHTKNGD